MLQPGHGHAPLAGQNVRQSVERLTSVVAYTLCSASMLLVNKMVMHAVPLPSLVSVAQFVTSCIAVLIACYMGSTTIERFRFVNYYPTSRLNIRCHGACALDSFNAVVLIYRLFLC